MVAASITLQNLLHKIERIKPIIKQHAPEAESIRHLPSVVYEAMYEAGLYAMFIPQSRGGPELHSVEALIVWEEVARIDSAAGWNLVMNSQQPQLMAWLPKEGVDDMFKAGFPTLAGAFFPAGEARRVEGGWQISGSIPFGTGCHNASWLVMAVIEMDGDEPKVNPDTGQPTSFAAFFPRNEAKILDAWDTLGMRGTGSTTYQVERLLVPDRPTASVGPLKNPSPGFEGPLYRIFPMNAVAGEAMVSVGIAQAAIEAAVEVVKTKTPFYNAVPSRDQQLIQYQLGKAMAAVDASRSTLHAAINAAHQETAQTGTSLSKEVKIRCQLAANFAAEQCAEATRLVNHAVGTAAIRKEQPFERYFRDAHTLLSHGSKSEPRYASAGRLMLGLANDWPWLDF